MCFLDLEPKSLFVPPLKIISRHTLLLCFLFCTYKHANHQKRLQSFFGWIFNAKNSSDTPIVSFSAKKRFAGWHVFVLIFHLNSEWKKCRRACLCLHLCKSTCLNLNEKNTRVFVFIYVGQSRVECRLSIRLMHAVYCKQCGKGNHRQGGDASVEQKT